MYRFLFYSSVIVVDLLLLAFFMGALLQVALRSGSVWLAIMFQKYFQAKREYLEELSKLEANESGTKGARYH